MPFFFSRHPSPITHRARACLVAAAVGVLGLGSAARAADTAPQAPPPAPTLVGRTLASEPVDLARLRGRVVLVFFWSTDCPVCLQRLPELRRNLQGWRGKPFTLVAVNLDRHRQGLVDYATLLDRVAPPTPQMLLLWRGEDGHRDDFGDLPTNTPTSVLLDRNGAVVKQVRGSWTPEWWDDIADLVVE